MANDLLRLLNDGGKMLGALKAFGKELIDLFCASTLNKRALSTHKEEIARFAKGAVGAKKGVLENG